MDAKNRDIKGNSSSKERALGRECLAQWVLKVEELQIEDDYI